MVGKSWFNSDAGSSCMQGAMLRAQPWLTGMHGHNALHVCAIPCLKDIISLPCQPAFYLHREQRMLNGDFAARDEELPVPNEIIRFVSAIGVLETAENSQALLVELARVLQAEGHLLILALNPISMPFLCGRWRGLNVQSAAHWQQQMQSAGLDVIQQFGVGDFWPRKKRKLVDNTYRPNIFRSVNFLLARKRKIALTPIRKNAHAVALAKESH